MSAQRAASLAKAHRRATYQEVLDAPPHKVAEIIDGTFYIQPRPAMPHAWASSGLGGIVGPPFNYGRSGPRGWWRERMPEYPDTAYCEIPTEWVCEVLSPSTSSLDKGEKRAVYAREGVRHLWFVDPDARTLEAFELSGNRWILLDTLTGDASVSLPPFEAISFSLGDLWPDSGTKNEDRSEGGKQD